MTLGTIGFSLREPTLNIEESRIYRVGTPKLINVLLHLSSYSGAFDYLFKKNKKQLNEDEHMKVILVMTIIQIIKRTSGRSNRILSSQSRSNIAAGPRQHSQSWFRTPQRPMTVFVFLPSFHILFNTYCVLCTTRTA
jgi:hypothetical protein